MEWRVGRKWQSLRHETMVPEIKNLQKRSSKKRIILGFSKTGAGEFTKPHLPEHVA